MSNLLWVVLTLTACAVVLWRTVRTPEFLTITNQNGRKP
jgi:hypothetical protein